MKLLELPPQAPTLSASVDALLRRAHYHRRRGEHHQALLALRNACNRSMDNPRLWGEYASACAKVHHFQDARHALGMARWLQRRAGSISLEVVDEPVCEVEAGAMKTSGHAA